MKRLTSIVAMNHDGAIGACNSLPWRLKADLQFFRRTTVGNVVIMGRLTFESLGSKPLPKRFNVVLTHSYNLFPSTPGCVSALGIDEGLLRADIEAGKAKECYIIGGASMYEQFAPYVDRYLITLVDKAVPDADTFVGLGIFGDPDDWEIEELARHGSDQENEADFTILELRSRRSDEITQLREQVIAERARLGRRTAQVSYRTRRESEEYRPAAALL